MVRRLWHSWDDGAVIQDAAGNRYADASKVRPFRHEGEYFTVAGPLNAIPFENGDPTIVSPGGSPRGLGFAGANSDVQLAVASLDTEKVRAYRASVHAAALAQGRESLGHQGAVRLHPRDRRQQRGGRPGGRGLAAPG